jgi:hypothetical protein
MNARTQTARNPLVAAICGYLLLLALAGVAVAKDSVRHRAPAGATAITSQITDSDTQATGTVDVVLYLRDQQALTDWQADRRAARTAAGIAAPGQHHFTGREKKRQSAMKRFAADAAKTSRSSQSRLAALVKRLGGEVTGSFPAPNTLYATVPAGALDELRSSKLVSTVALEGERQYLAAVGTPAWYVAADTWHDADCTGAGAADTSCPTTTAPRSITGPVNSPDGHGGPDFGVDDQGVNCHHEAFNGGPTPSLGRTPSVSRPADAPTTAAANNKGCPTNVSGDNGSLHGNTIAAIVAVKHPDHIGAAYGVDKILDPTRSCVRSESWLVGITTQSQFSTCATNAAGASDPEEVQNRSYMFPADWDKEDTDYDQLTDMGAASFGVAQATAAGNGGPYAPQSVTLRACTSGNANSETCQYRVQHPCASYNSICTGSNTGGADLNYRTSDDTVAKFSSRGPTVGGRKKPDLVAPYGYGQCPNGQYGGVANPAQDEIWKSGSICGEGTSYAAPYTAAGQLLLVSVGVTAPAAQKAILINSAKSITTTETGTVQQFWTPDVGWGELDLDAAFTQRGNFRTGSITEAPTSNARFYRINGQSTADRTTLTWNRRVAVGSFGYLGLVSAVTTLDLYQLTLAGADNDQDVCGPSTTCGVDSSESTDTGPTSIVSGEVRRWEANTDGQDTVNQVRAKNAGDSIVKVVAHSPVVGAPSEDYAIASTQPLAPLSTPTLTVPSPALSKQLVGIGETVTVNATATSNSTGADLVDGLALDSGTLKINLPSGVQLVSGTATQSVGTINPAQTKNANWTIQRTAEGAGEVTITASGSRFGETFETTSAGSSITADLTAPTIDLAAPSGWQPAAANTVTWTSEDENTGVDRVVVEVSVAGGAFTPIYDGDDSAGGASVSAGEGEEVQIRAHAVDAAGNESTVKTASWKVNATGPTLALTAPTSTTIGTAARVGIDARSAGPVTVTYRIAGGAWTPTTANAVFVNVASSTTKVDATATDQFGRTASKSVTITGQKIAPKVSAKVTGKKKKRVLLVTTNPAVSGRANVTVKCGKKTTKKKASVRSGRAKIKLYKLTGRCSVKVSFAPASADRYLDSRFSRRLKL